MLILPGKDRLNFSQNLAADNTFSSTVSKLRELSSKLLVTENPNIFNSLTTLKPKSAIFSGVLLIRPIFKTLVLL